MHVLRRNNEVLGETTVDGRSEVYALVDRGPDRLLVQADGGVREIPMSSVQRLELRTRRSQLSKMGRGLFIGGLVGGSVGALLGLADGDDPQGSWIRFSAGDKALLGGAVLHLIPQAVEMLGSSLALSLWFLVGFLGFFLLERTLWTHTHEISDEALEVAGHGHPGGHVGHHVHGHPHPVVAMVLAGDGLHNLIDGMIIAAAYAADVQLGLIATLAVVVHEVPQEIGDLGVLVFGGLSVRNALLLNFLSATMAIVGAVFTLVVGARYEGLLTALIPITAGSFLYIAAADLIPELHRGHSGGRGFRHAVTLLIGVGLMLGLRLMEPALGG